MGGKRFSPAGRRHAAARVLFDTTYPVSMLEEYTYKLIERFAPKLILGISDELSSTGDIERVRIVG